MMNKAENLKEQKNNGVLPWISVRYYTCKKCGNKFNTEIWKFTTTKVVLLLMVAGLISKGLKTTKLSIYEELY